jgi:hypothetical protein
MTTYPGGQGTLKFHSCLPVVRSSANTNPPICSKPPPDGKQFTSAAKSRILLVLVLVLVLVRMLVLVLVLVLVLLLPLVPFL